MMDRRDFLAAGAVGAAGLVLPSGVTAASRRRRRLIREAVFDCGVMAGAPRLRGITLWTHAQGLDRSGHLRLEIARDEQFSRVVHRELVQSQRSMGYTARAAIRSRRLQPGERYWYRFETTTGSSPVGRFTTAPGRQPGAAADRLLGLPGLEGRALHRACGARTGA